MSFKDSGSLCYAYSLSIHRTKLDPKARKSIFWVIPMEWNDTLYYTLTLKKLLSQEMCHLMNTVYHTPHKHLIHLNHGHIILVHHLTNPQPLRHLIITLINISTLYHKVYQILNHTIPYMKFLRSVSHYLHLFQTYLKLMNNLLHPFMHLQALHTSHVICSTMYVPYLKTLNNHLKVCFILFLFPCLIIIYLRHIVTIPCLFHHTLSLSLVLRLASLIVGIKLCKLNLLHLRRQVLWN